MRDDIDRLRRWLRRAQPPRAALAKALFAGFVASMSNVALLVGAVALLVESANRPGLRAVLGVLIVIELFAFLRSPLRFAERLSAHRLGYAAVTHWRRWLVLAIGGLDFSRWRTYAAGDLLERSLRDTDELQDLWLRCVIPLLTTALVMVVSDVTVAVLPARGSWVRVALVLAALQVVATLGLVANVGPLLGRDRILRVARGNYRAQLVELSAVTPDLAILGRTDFAVQRSSESVARLGEAEVQLHRQHNLSRAITVAAGVLALSTVALRPPSSPVWTVVVTMLALSTLDQLSTLMAALDTAIAVSAGAERLEQLEGAARLGVSSWPVDETLRLDDVTIVEEGGVLVANATFSASPGHRVAITGPSGVGKSTLLRALAALEAVTSGTVSIGGVAVGLLNEGELRQHLAYVASEPGLMRGLALDVIHMGRASERSAGNDLATVGIDAELSTRWDELSRGERERVAIVRALVSGPAILLLDEPTAGLGRHETAAVLSLLESTGATVIVATHDDQVIEWCAEVLELRGTALVAASR